MSLPSEAPVIRVMLNGSSAARRASAKGTALQSPAGESAHADHHAVSNQLGGLVGLHHLVMEPGQADAFLVHQSVSFSGGARRGHTPLRRAPQVHAEVYEGFHIPAGI